MHHTVKFIQSEPLCLNINQFNQASYQGHFPKRAALWETLVTFVVLIKMAASTVFK